MTKQTTIVVIGGLRVKICKNGNKKILIYFCMIANLPGYKLDHCIINDSCWICQMFGLHFKI